MIINAIYCLLIVPPTITPFSFGSSPLNAGGFVNLQCIVGSGDLPVNITWAYPGNDTLKPTVTTSKVADRVAMLTIDVLTANHAGNYTCVATNSAQTVTHTATLQINGSQFAPEFTPFPFWLISVLHDLTSQTNLEILCMLQICSNSCIIK